MKNMIRLFFVAGFCMLILSTDILAQKVIRAEALTAAENYITKRHLSLSISISEPLVSENDTIAWVFQSTPQGFIVISTSQLLPPVLAWSVEGSFGEGTAWENFLPIFQYDLKSRHEFADPESAVSMANQQKWVALGSHNFSPGDFQQWPPAGWSSTGGWLFTNWTQSAPFNNLCPIDGQTQIRSYAGCPATAMAQILNFHHKTNGTRFDDTDDYYHSYGAGNSYWIDNDWETRGFPSWNQLNTYLDTLEAHYANSTTLTNTDKAALTYACGAAAKQVYSSSGSGTYGVDQAYGAYVRFGYSDARLDGPLNPELNMQLAQNIMLALPAHLALVNPAWTVGHNVVVDGYNTDDLFHFNFGWGGSANGWYTMPPTNIPYDLTVIEGLVLDINLSDPPVGLTQANPVTEEPNVCYSKEEGLLRIRLAEATTPVNIFIYDMTGKLIKKDEFSYPGKSAVFEMPLPCLASGVYIAKLVTDHKKISSCKFIR